MIDIAEIYRASLVAAQAELKERMAEAMRTAARAIDDLDNATTEALEAFNASATEAEIAFEAAQGMKLAAFRGEIGSVLTPPKLPAPADDEGADIRRHRPEVGVHAMPRALPFGLDEIKEGAA